MSVQDRPQAAAGAVPPAVLAAVRAAEPGARHRGRPLVVGIDGRSGAGKSALAAALVDVLARDRPRTGAVGLLALEDAYRGWDGLAAGLAEVADGVLGPLRRGRPGRYRAYDWHAGRVDGVRAVPPPGTPVPEVLVVEGCGAGSAVLAPSVDVLVWLEAPEPVRHRRALERDGGTWAHRWDGWAAQEQALLDERDARAAADVVVATG
ncbi:hypothetical protein MF406_08065 [Georgenia sp. TF02-10]|uniref:uridine kinase family protein n=1 Tax=Georgenia sp. TF02-10 TaxID=2917725 RepID=UPI001FA8006E|nr:hypothetical protein [Georgenia sp. TF02-10]UNX56144.1 hypothetical protein MF406_08065 [Georgenia sp. TF02-10]